MDAKFLDFVYCYGCVDGPFAERDLSNTCSQADCGTIHEIGNGKTGCCECDGELDKFRILTWEGAFGIWSKSCLLRRRKKSGQCPEDREASAEP